MTVLVALQVLYQEEFDSLCKGVGGREDRLKAFFSSEGDETNVPIALKTVAARIGAGIEVRSITSLRGLST